MSNYTALCVFAVALSIIVQETTLAAQAEPGTGTAPTDKSEQDPRQGWSEDSACDTGAILRFTVQRATEQREDDDTALKVADGDRVRESVRPTNLANWDHRANTHVCPQDATVQGAVTKSDSEVRNAAPRHTLQTCCRF
ncbi:hypothetical protein AWM79_13245 [Pseudomonas agarici]|uniref:Uncharacterized protein n=1 Tax=Pseudomonas agarici TaxID=46677 RepID=A0A0X1T2D0_PSEAA|nr:hypothetical protein [Pseudomonas agarici]AMB86213.1 hypothetical protein AWM79_13245 [Pseudomonas agarici]NWB90196.1 hypothetical protein [Pseudomonas agarici]NWC08873.1 hypothetical protein [Pseudomonas agarici]SEK60207.1 hypothetical protein SAMN05216604_104209 [Pseudomonas agarici]